MAKKSVTAIAVKVMDMTMIQAISTFNEHEQKLYKELAEYIRKHNKENIQWYWDLGVRMTGINADAKKNKEHYGSNIMGRLCSALGFKTTGPLYKAMDVVEAFGTKKAFLEYAKLAGEAGNTLSWGHIVMLSGIPDQAMRLELAATSLEQAWTVDQLGEQVRKLVERKSRGIRRAKPKTKIPSSVKKCLQHVTTRAEEFVFQFKTAWTGDAFNLTSEIDNLPTSNLNDKLLEDITAARTRMAELIESAQQMEAELANANISIRRKLAAQADADEAAELAANAAAIEEEQPDDDDDSYSDDDDNVTVVGVYAEELPDDDEDDDEEDEEEDEAVIEERRNAMTSEKRALARASERARNARAR